MTSPASPDPILDAYARVLRQRRLAAGLSQEELAGRAGLSPRYVSLLETRKHQPTLATLQALAHVLDLRLSDMIREVEEASE